MLEMIGITPATNFDNVDTCLHYNMQMCYLIAGSYNYIKLHVVGIGKLCIFNCTCTKPQNFDRSDHTAIGIKSQKLHHERFIPCKECNKSSWS